jgi:hypothetical protein
LIVNNTSFNIKVCLFSTAAPLKSALARQIALKPALLER